MSSSSALRQAGPESDEGELRSGVVHLGALLGWDESVVARFAEAVTGHDWICCERPELLDVLAAYASLAHRVRAAQARLPGGSGACDRARTAKCDHHLECAAVANGDVEW